MRRRGTGTRFCFAVDDFCGPKQKRSFGFVNGLLLRLTHNNDYLDPMPLPVVAGKQCRAAFFHSMLDAVWDGIVTSSHSRDEGVYRLRR